MIRRVGPMGIVLCLLSAWSCSTSNVTGPDGGDSGNTSEPVNSEPVLQTSGRVMLPGDSAVQLEGLTVVNSLESVESVAADGKFTLTNAGEGPMLSAVVNADGDPVLLAFTDTTSADPPEISARESAAALLFMALGAFNLPPEEYANVLDLIRQSEYAPAVAALIEQRLKTNPKWLVEDDPELIDMLQSIADQVRNPAAKTARPDVPQTTDPPRQAQQEPQAVSLIIDPRLNFTETSGITVEQSTDNLGVFIVNYYRRYAKYFAYKVGYLDANDEEHDVDPPMGVPLKDGSFALGVILDSTQSLDGVIGSLLGAFVLNDLAYSPKPSKVITLPLGEGEKEGYFEIIIAGALEPTTEGEPSPGPDFFEASSEELQAEWRAASSFSTLLSVGADIILPALFSVAIPAQSLADGEVDSEDIVAFMLELIEEAPELSIKISRREFGDIAKSVVKSFFDNPGVREAFLNLLVKGFGEGFKEGKVYGALNAANNFFSAADIGLSAIDIGVVVHDLAVSRPYERFEITAIAPKVRIEPSMGEVTPGESIDLVAYSTADGTKQFRWSTDGLQGAFDDGNGGMVTELETPSNTVTYISSESAQFGVEETVSVEVVVPDPANPGGTPVRIGDAIAKVTAGFKVTIEPEVVAINAGQSRTLTANPNKSGNLSFLWVTTGVGGEIRDGSGQRSREFLDTMDSEITYVADDDITFGDLDTINVEVTEDNVILGTAQAQVSGIGDNQILIKGSVIYRTATLSNGAGCCGAHRIVPKVQGATNYSVYIHGYDDPLFWQTEYTDNINPDNPRVRDGGGKMTPQVDEGGQWSIGLSGGCGGAGGSGAICATLKERFAGMIVDVTVTLEP